MFGEHEGNARGTSGNSDTVTLAQATPYGDKSDESIGDGSLSRIVIALVRNTAKSIEEEPLD